MHDNADTLLQASGINLAGRSSYVVSFGSCYEQLLNEPGDPRSAWTPFYPVEVPYLVSKERILCRRANDSVRAMRVPCRYPTKEQMWNVNFPT